MTSMAEKKDKQKHLAKFFEASKQALIKARDLYIKSMSKCDGNVGSYGGAMGGPTTQFSNVHRSFSLNSTSSTRNDEDLRELMRINSARSLGDKVESKIISRQSSATGRGFKVMPRSTSVGIKRIDEDKPCEFAEEDVPVRAFVYPRSRSVAFFKKT